MTINGSIKPGPILFFGSGETLPSSGTAYEHLAKNINGNPRISILETPAGFEPNSHKVVDKIAIFIRKRLQNYYPRVHLIPARQKNSNLSPDNPEILDPMLHSNWLFMGPGSPTYAVRQLKESLAFEYLFAMHLNGAALSLASAGVLAFSAYTLPVYEIYKVGEDLHWENGLDYFSLFGLNLVFIPHWNNNDGGIELDTSRCFMGKARFNQLIKMIPEQTTIIGIDEQTALCFYFCTPCSCRVFGKGGVTIIRGDDIQVITNGQEIPTGTFGDYKIPNPDECIQPSIWQKIQNANESDMRAPSPHVRDLLKAREKARGEKNWNQADDLRDEIHAHGWEIQDAADGPELIPINHPF